MRVDVFPTPHHVKNEMWMPTTVGAGESTNISQLRGTGGEPLRVALAHDWLCGLRGGEHVLEDCITALGLGGAVITGLYCMFDDHRSLAPGIDSQHKYCAGLGHLPLASTRLRKHLLPLYPLATHQLTQLLRAHQPTHRADVLLSTSSCAVKGISTQSLNIPHISYIHSPARYLWGRADEYAMGDGGMLRRLGLTLCGPAMRRWDRRTASNAHHLLANSTHTAALIASAWGREAKIMFPGVRTAEFAAPCPPPPRDGSWLIVSALEPYKRIDLAIAAAERAGVNITIVGNGSQRSALTTLARSCVRAKVTFTGRIDDAKLLSYYHRAGTFLYPQVEDFGITAVEAQAAGLPVTAFAAGGALDTVIDGKTGVHFQTQSAESLAAAARACVELGSLPQTAAACAENARRFSRERFFAELTMFVAGVVRGGGV
jgi:glycosyltransferase involved in cell wall biosynthesis